MRNHCGFRKAMFIRPPAWSFNASCTVCDVCYNGTMDIKYKLLKNIDCLRGLYKCTGCDKDFVRYHNNIKKGKSKSCQKCGSGNYSLPKEISHLYKTKIYNVWDSMVRRATNKKHRDYYSYGGIGRKLETLEWREFKNFANDMLPSYNEHVALHGEKNTSLDRIDNDKGYSKSNCRWATQKEQCRNTSKNKLLTVDGITKPLAYWSEKYDINYQTIRGRLETGWTEKMAVTIPKNGFTFVKSNTGQKNITLNKKWYLVKYKNKHIGSYKTIEQAILARDEAYAKG